MSKNSIVVRNSLWQEAIVVNKLHKPIERELWIYMQTNPYIHVSGLYLIRMETIQQDLCFYSKNELYNAFHWLERKQLVFSVKEHNLYFVPSIVTNYTDKDSPTDRNYDLSVIDAFNELSHVAEYHNVPSLLNISTLLTRAFLETHFERLLTTHLFLVTYQKDNLRLEHLLANIAKEKMSVLKNADASTQTNNTTNLQQ